MAKGRPRDRRPLFKRWTPLILLPIYASGIYIGFPSQSPFAMAPADGVEPPPTESESVVLPLYEAGIWQAREELNLYKRSQSPLPYL